MNAPFRRTFAIPAACGPVNEMLAAVMRSFGENPAQPRDNWTTDHGTRRPKACKSPQPLRDNSCSEHSDILNSCLPAAPKLSERSRVH